MGLTTEWKMPQQVSDYFANEYKNQPLSNIDYATVWRNPHVGGPLLDPSQYLPYQFKGKPVDKDWEEKLKNTSGYIHPGKKPIYIDNLDSAGHQVNPVEPNILPEDPKAGSLSSALAIAQNRELKKKAQEETQRLQDYSDWESSRIARTGLHESIHHILGKESKKAKAYRLRYSPDSIYHEGAYSNAIAEMLRGTSVLGVPADDTKYLGERDINDQYIESRYSPRYEQSELLTQALTELFYPKQRHPDRPENDPMRSPIFADYGYSHWNMDKPGGPMTKEGLDKFLFKRSQPFYEQILSDAKAGYVQSSIWSTKD